MRHRFLFEPDTAKHLGVDWTSCLARYPAGRAALLAACLLTGPLPAHAAGTAGPAITEWPRCLVGPYEGGQTEMAARLELTEDRRFTYQLSYGALDEGSEGRWEPVGNDVVLTSDPVNAPRYSLVADEPLPARELRIVLDLPRGVSAQYFEALVGFVDGSRMIRQLSDDGLVVPLDDGREVQSVAIMLSVYSLQSEAFPVAGTGGRSVRVRFEPNELGKVAFAGTRLRREGADLLIDRHERALRFRPEGRGCVVR